MSKTLIVILVGAAGVGGYLWWQSYTASNAAKAASYNAARDTRRKSRAMGVAMNAASSPASGNLGWNAARAAGGNNT